MICTIEIGPNLVETIKAVEISTLMAKIARWLGLLLLASGVSSIGKDLMGVEVPLFGIETIGLMLIQASGVLLWYVVNR